MKTIQTDTIKYLKEFVGTNDSDGIAITTTSNNTSGITLSNNSGTTTNCIWNPPYNGDWFHRWEYRDLTNPYNSQTSTSITLNLGYIMKKVAIFKVERDKKTNKVTSAELVDEMWIPSDVGASLHVAKKLIKAGKDFDEKNTVIREILSVTL